MRTSNYIKRKIERELLYPTIFSAVVSTISYIFNSCKFSTFYNRSFFSRFLFLLILGMISGGILMWIYCIMYSLMHRYDVR